MVGLAFMLGPLQEVCMKLLRFGRNWIRGLWFSPDGGTLIAVEGTERYPIRLHWLDLHRGESIRTWSIPCGEFALSADFLTIAQMEMETRPTDWEGALFIRSVEDPDAESPRAQLRATLSSLAFSPDGQMLLVACYQVDESFEPECEIRRFDRKTSSYLTPLAVRSPVKAMAMTRRGDRLITGGADNRVRIWQYPEHQQLGEWPHKNMIHQVVLSPDERILASVAGRSAALWDMKDNRQIVRLTTHAAPVNDLAFSADGRTLATACLDGTVRLWDVATGQQRQAFDWNIGQAGAVAFSYDGLTIAAGGQQGRVVIWDVDA
jgi:WD40 repeat protein